METPEQEVKFLQSPERRHQRRSVFFIANTEYIPHTVLVFPLLTLNK